MKTSGILTARILLGLCLAAPTVSSLVAQSTSAAAAADPYTKAVNEYVTAAQKELAAIRSEVAATEKSGRKVDLEPLKSSLDRCDSLVEQLKSAGPAKFDTIKAAYEKARGEMVTKLGKVRS
jgi:Zn-dependent oligopeptidase